MQRTKAWVPWVVGALSAFALFQLLQSNLPGRQWWSKRFQALIAAALVLASITRIVVRGASPNIIPALLYGSLLGGIVQSVGGRFC
jgi:hypothetical protein